MSLSETPAAKTSHSRMEAGAKRVQQAFRSGRTRPFDWRDQQLDAIQQAMIERESDLLASLSDDLGKPRAEALTGEIDFIRKDAAYVAKKYKGWAKAKSVGTPLATLPGASSLKPEPLGAALILGAWNYPAQQIFNPLIGAIAAGCAAVCKPSELAPATAEVIADIGKAYLDAEAIEIVTGGADAAEALLAEKFDTIFFTGSAAIGRSVMAAAARHLTPVTLELGGKSPAIVLADCDLEVTARRLVWGRFMNAGQLCVSPDYVLAEASIRDALIAALGKAVEALYGAHPKTSADYGRIVNHRHFDRLMALMESGRVAHGGDHDRGAKYIAPTVLTDVKLDAPVMQEEIFGPLLPVISVDGLDAALDIVNDRPRPLTLYGFSKNKQNAERIINETSSGSVLINDTVVFQVNPNLPFGGVGESGTGRFHGRYSFLAFSHEKAVMTRGFSLDSALRYPPYDEKKLKTLRKLS